MAPVEPMSAYEVPYRETFTRTVSGTAASVTASAGSDSGSDAAMTTHVAKCPRSVRRFTAPPDTPPA